MSIRGRAFRRAALRRGVVCTVVFAVLAAALCLTVREYGHRARIRLAGNPAALDSVARSISLNLKSPQIAKGGALSAMRGDFSSLLARSIAEPGGKVNAVLKSFSPDSSLLAMKKLCSSSKGGEVCLSYFSYDSLSSLKTFEFFSSRALAMVPEAFKGEMKEAGAGNSLFGLGLGSMPWRSCCACLALLFFIWLALCAIWWMRRRRLYKEEGLRNLKEASKAIEGGKDSGRGGSSVLLGALEEFPHFREKYCGALIRKRQVGELASRIRKSIPDKEACLVNILCVDETCVYKIRRSGLLEALIEGRASHLMEYGQDLDSSSTAYRFPDTVRLKEENSGNLLIMLHPPLSTEKVPEAYLQDASLNIIVSDAKAGWPESYKAFASNIPNSGILLVDMPVSGKSRKVLKDAGKPRRYLPSERRFSFVVLLCSSYTPALVEKTCRSLYYSSTGEDSKGAESLMEVSALGFEYEVRPFRLSAGKVLSNLEVSSSEADAFVVLKAGCTVGKNFLSDICSAFYAGADAVQCRVEGRAKTSGTFKRDSRRGLSCRRQEFGFAATGYGVNLLKNTAEGERPEFFMDYLEDTSVFFL